MKDELSANINMKQPIKGKYFDFYIYVLNQSMHMLHNNFKDIYSIYK